MLCEKPFTANAAEAREIAELAAKSDRVVMEAFHYRYHPLALRVEEIIASGELGTLQRVEAAMCFPMPKFSDIRYNYSLAGGALMDPGCYAVDMVRTFGGSTPEVVSAQAKLRDPQVDRAMTAELRFAGGHTGRIRCSMWSTDLLAMTAKVVGDRGELAAQSVMPHFPAVLRPVSRRQTGGALSAPRHLCLSAGRVRCRGAARGTGEDDAGGRDREHDRHRFDLSRGRSLAARAELSATRTAWPTPPTTNAMPPRHTDVGDRRG